MKQLDNDKFIWRIIFVLPWIIWNFICLTQTNHHLIHFVDRKFSVIQLYTTGTKSSNIFYRHSITFSHLSLLAFKLDFLPLKFVSDLQMQKLFEPIFWAFVYMSIIFASAWPISNTAKTVSFNSKTEQELQ